MTSVATNTANNVGREVALLRTVVLAVANFSTILAGLVFVVAQSTVERGKLAELIALQLILSFWDRRGLNMSVNAEGMGAAYGPSQ